MAKFHGEIGYVESTETAPGVFKEVATEISYTGDILRDVKSWENGQRVNDNINVSNRFSIVADPFAFNNVTAMRYIKWMGTLWKITNVEVQRPRLILTVGGVYNAS